MTTIRAKEIVGTRFPTDAGADLANYLLNMTVDDVEDESKLEIDLRGCPPSQIISGFFNGFLQKIADDKGVEICEHAKSIKWTTDHEFQAKNIAKWVRDFVPNRKK